MAGTRRLTQLVETATGLLDLPDGPLVVALSGGADSAALAYLVSAMDREVRGVHVDHRLSASPTMRMAAVTIAGKVGIDLEVVETEVSDGPSPEGQAREARYRALGEATGREESVLTAHTADDNAETVIINLIRGTGTRGLAGIPRHRSPNVYRPLLGIGRSSTREIAGLAGLGFVDDPMNLDPGLTRNYLRATVFPLLTQLNPDLSGAIGRMSDLVRADADLIDTLAARIQISSGPGTARVPMGALAATPDPVTDRVLMAMIAHVTGSPGVTADLLSRVDAVVRGDARTSQLLGTVEARRHGPFLVIEGMPPSEPGVVGLSVGETRWGRLVFELSKRDEVCQVAPLSRWHAVFPPGTMLTVESNGVVHADGNPAWVPGEKRLPVAWYSPGTVGYLSVFAREDSGWTSSP